MGEGDDRQDRALVKRIRAEGTSSRAAWGELVQRYQDRLYAVCLRMVSDPETAADLTQDAFVKVIQGLDTWDGRARLSTWIIRVTMNVCLSHLRAAKVRRHSSLDQPIQSPFVGGASDEGPITTVGSRVEAREPGTGSSVQGREQQRRLLAALADLDPEQRAIIVLRDVQGLDYEQIAAALGIAVGTVKSRLFRARLALRQLIEKSTQSE
jgi:RNA polymerase sigma-70 factor (ECF subfamily)